MRTFYTMLIGLNVAVTYFYEEADRGTEFEPSYPELITIADIEIECRSENTIHIDPNELHASQLEDLEKEAMAHYKDRA